MQAGLLSLFFSGGGNADGAASLALTGQGGAQEGAALFNPMMEQKMQELVAAASAAGGMAAAGQASAPALVSSFLQRLNLVFTEEGKEGEALPPPLQALVQLLEEGQLPLLQLQPADNAVKVFIETPAADPAQTLTEMLSAEEIDALAALLGVPVAELVAELRPYAASPQAMRQWFAEQAQMQGFDPAQAERLAQKVAAGAASFAAAQPAEFSLPQTAAEAAEFAAALQRIAEAGHPLTLIFTPPAATENAVVVSFAQLPQVVPQSVREVTDRLLSGASALAVIAVFATAEQAVAMQEADISLPATDEIVAAGVQDAGGDVSVPGFSVENAPPRGPAGSSTQNMAAASSANGQGAGQPQTSDTGAAAHLPQAVPAQGKTVAESVPDEAAGRFVNDAPSAKPAAVSLPQATADALARSLVSRLETMVATPGGETVTAAGVAGDLSESVIAALRQDDGLHVTAQERDGLIGNRATGPAFAARFADADVPVREQVLIQIQRSMEQGSRHVSIQLEPAELGRVHIQMELSKDGHTQLAITADNRETLQLLQRDARQLAEALNDLGLQASPHEMSFNLQEQGDSQSQQDEEGYAGAAPEAEASGTNPANNPVKGIYQHLIVNLDEGVNIQV